jgi:hypothetical protein
MWIFFSVRIVCYVAGTDVSFPPIVETKDQNFLYVAAFYTDNCFYEKSTIILHLYRNYYIPGLVHNLNTRQYVSSIAVQRMRTQAIS